jgi:hypothetical protein
MPSTKLYIMGSDRGPKKVGIAANPALRLRRLQTGNSRELRVLFQQEAPEGLATDIERRAHWLLREHKTHGEWFSVSAKAAIEAVAQAISENGEGEKERPSVGRRPLKKNVATVITAIRLPADVAARIDERAGEGKRSEWIRRLIANELRKPVK